MVDFFKSWSSAQPDASIIKSWYETNTSADDNPFELIDLNDRIRDMLTFIKKKLPSNADKTAIISSLKAYYKGQAEKQQKSDLIYIKFLYEAQKLLLPPNKIKMDFDKEYAKFMPQIAEHFKPEILQILKFGDNLNVADIFIDLVTIDVVQNLDKQSIQEQEKVDISLKFAYESHLESLYTKLIIKMIEKSPTLEGNWITMQPVIDYLNQYPFRLLNKEGVQVPENFYLSACNYIKNGIKPSEAFMAFFYKIDNIRSNKAGIKEKSDFITAFDASKPTTLRSISFREDFDYLNSLNVKGFQLNRNFWQMLDNKIVNDGSKDISTFLKAAQTSKNIDEFYNKIKTGVSGGFNLEELKAQVDSVARVCQTPKAEPEDQIMATNASTQEEPLQFSAAEYNFWRIKGAKATLKQNNKFLAVADKDAAVIRGSLVFSKDIREMTEEDKSVIYYDYDENKKLFFKNGIALDTDPDRVKDENYLACFYNNDFFDKEELEDFIQVNYDSDVQQQRQTYQNSLNKMDLVDEIDKLGRVITGSRKKGPMSGIPREKIINHLQFVYMDVQNYTDMITVIFDVCSMSKSNIIEFIKYVTTKKKPTFYNVYYSLEEPEEEEDREIINTMNHDISDDDDDDKQQELAVRIEKYKSLRVERQEDIKNRLTQLRDEELMRLIEQKAVNLENLNAIDESEKNVADNLDKEKAVIEEKLKLAEKDLQDQLRAKLKNEAYFKYVKKHAKDEQAQAEEIFQLAFLEKQGELDDIDVEIKKKETIIKIFTDKKRGYEKGIMFGRNKNLDAIFVEAQLKLSRDKYNNPEVVRKNVAQLKTLIDNSKAAAKLEKVTPDIVPDEVIAANAALQQNLINYKSAAASYRLKRAEYILYGLEEEYYKAASQAENEAFRAIINNYEIVNSWLCEFYNQYKGSVEVSFHEDAKLDDEQIDTIVATISKEFIDEVNAIRSGANADENKKKEINYKLDYRFFNQVMNAQKLAEKFKQEIQDITENINKNAKKEEDVKETRANPRCPPLGYESKDKENWCFNEKLIKKLTADYSKINTTKQRNASVEAASEAEKAAAAAAAAASAQPQSAAAQAAKEAARAAAETAAMEAARLASTPYAKKLAEDKKANEAKAERAKAKAASTSEKTKFTMSEEDKKKFLETRLKRSLEKVDESVMIIIDVLANKLRKSIGRANKSITVDQIKSKITEIINSDQISIKNLLSKALTLIDSYNKIKTFTPRKFNGEINKLIGFIKYGDNDLVITEIAGEPELVNIKVNMTKLIEVLANTESVIIASAKKAVEATKKAAADAAEEVRKAEEAAAAGAPNAEAEAALVEKKTLAVAAAAEAEEVAEVAAAVAEVAALAAPKAEIAAFMQKALAAASGQ